MKKPVPKDKKTLIRNLLIPLLLIFLVQIIILFNTFFVFYKKEAASIRDVGVSNLRSQSLKIENYVDNGRDILWLAAESVSNMLQSGESHEAVHKYLMNATSQMKQRFDKNFTGIYGVIDGVYMDGSDWIPPAGYIYEEREWYITAVRAEGDTVITKPYTDAQTGSIIISFVQMLNDGKSVIALDIVLDEVQESAEKMTVNDRGCGFITDSEGMVIAHSDPSERGKNYLTDGTHSELLKHICNENTGSFETVINGVRYTVFSENIVEDWHTVILISNSALFEDLRMWMIISCVMLLLTFIFIAVFCIISAHNILEADRKECESREKLQQFNMSIIRALVSTIDAKDRYTSGHSQRVAKYSKEIAKRMGKTEEDQQIIFYAGLLHDVGKIHVPDAVINKGGKLTDEEFDRIRIHPVSGFHILRGTNDDARIGYGTKYHHERYDGHGYPNGLEGDNIPEVARIIAVADAYDAMTSNRSYRKALAQDVVSKEIERGIGRQFDPAAAGIMLEMIKEDKDYDLREKEHSTSHILVVDDEIMSLKMVENILSDNQKIKVHTARNEKEAFSELEDSDISLILLDLVMPETDGFSLYLKIREKYSVPVVLMTSDKSSDTLHKIRELGIDDYLTKPLNAAVTMETIHSILQGGYEWC